MKDKEGKFITLTQAALMHIDCDLRAEEFYTHPYETQQSISLINPKEAMCIYFTSNGIINIGNLYNQIVRDRHGTPLKNYIKKNFKWNDEYFDKIAWSSIKTGLTAKTPKQKCT